MYEINATFYSHFQPTITTLDSTDHPVWEIDFPGVTICPANKVVKEKLDQVFETQMLVGRNKMERLELPTAD